MRILIYKPIRSKIKLKIDFRVSLLNTIDKKIYYRYNNPHNVRCYEEKLLYNSRKI